jgi:hypothetical protein
VRRVANSELRIGENHSARPNRGLCPKTAAWEIAPPLSPSVYRRIRRGNPKFWASGGAPGSNIAGACPARHNLMIERSYLDMCISPRPDLPLRRLLFGQER